MNGSTFQARVSEMVRKGADRKAFEKYNWYDVARNGRPMEIPAGRAKFHSHGAPVADTANKWVQVARNGPDYVAAAGKASM